MTIEIDHIMIPAGNKDKAAEKLASILDVEWGPANAGPFTAVYVSSGLTIDFDQWNSDFPKGHYCFRVGDDEFDEILGRIKNAGMAYRSQPHGDDDYQIDTSHGGKIVYWNEPEGHVWELLTKSYARLEK